MTDRAHKVEPTWRYEQAEEAALALEQLLAHHGIRVREGSQLEAHVLQVMRLRHHKDLGNNAPIERDFRDTYRVLVGVHELANLILEVKHSPSFPALLPHLRLLNEGAALQNMLSLGQDQATNKLFELFAATLAMQCGADVLLDDPLSSRGDNPDVLVTLRGRRWGIACKVLHSLHPEGFLQNLQKGLDQIERSAAGIGVVLFNLKQVLPHDEIWPMADIPDTGGADRPPEQGPAAWPTASQPFQLLVDSLDRLGETLVSYLPPGYLNQMFIRKKSAPGFLLWAHSVSAVLVDGRPSPTSVRALNFRQLAPISPDIHFVLKCLDWAAFLSSPTRGPKPR